MYIAKAREEQACQHSARPGPVRQLTLLTWQQDGAH